MLLFVVLQMLLATDGYGQERSGEHLSDPKILVAQQVDSLLNIYDQVVTSTPDQALEHATQALQLSEQNKYAEGISKSTYRIGRAQFGLSNFEEATIYLHKSQELFELQGDYRGLVLSLKWLGSANRHLNNTNEALEYYFTALEWAEKINFPTEIPKVTQNIAGIFLEQGQYQEAIEYFEKSLPKIDDTYSTSTCLANLGLAYLKNDENDKALNCFNQSIELCKSINDQECELLPLSFLAGMYSNKKNYKKALTYYLSMLERQEKTGSVMELLILKNSIGLTYLDMGNYPKATAFFMQTLVLAKQIQHRSLPYIYANLSLSSQGENNLELALEHLWTFQDLKDSLFNVEKNQKVDELLVQFDTEKKEQEIVILQKEKELQEAELAKQTFERNLAIAGGLLAIILAFVFRSIFQQKTAASRQLVAITASIEGQEKERTRIGQELHDGIAGNLASIKLKLAKLSKSEESKLQQVIDNIDDTYKEVRIISHHLMPPQVEEGAFVALIHHYLNDINEMSDFEVRFNCQPEADINKIPNHIKIELYRIIQELMSNLIKHAKAKSANIQFILFDHHLNLLVEDTGVGFDKSKNADGIGLKNVTSRISKLKGSMQIDSTPNKGTTINIDIPIP